MIVNRGLVFNQPCVTSISAIWAQANQYIVLRMQKIFLLFIYIHLSSSALSNSFVRRNEIGLEVKYREYLDNPKQENYADFEDYVIEHYNQYRLDCLTLEEYHRSRYLKNMTIFWIALRLTRQFFNPKFNLRRILQIIVDEIRSIIQYSDYSNELTFKKKFEVASLMIESVERIHPELKFRGVDDELVNNLDERIAIWKFLIKNISIDFNEHTVNYDSLYRTFNEIRYIIKMNLSSEKASQLSKLCSLLYYYIHRIYETHCLAIFESHHNYNSLIISLIIKVYYWTLEIDSLGEFNSNRLSSYLKKLYKDDFKHLNLSMEILKTRNPNKEISYVMKNLRKVSSFFELTRFFTDKFEKNFACWAWEFKALAELESYLNRNGLKVCYPN